jgi:hypothetical protein
VDVQIQSIQTEIHVTEGVGALAPEDVRKLVSLVMEHLREQQHADDQRKADVIVKDRSFEKRGL